MNTRKEGLGKKVMEDDSRFKLKKIILFSLNKSIINLAREMVIILEHSKMDKTLFESNRKYVFDTCNQTIRDITELINTAL